MTLSQIRAGLPEYIMLTPGVHRWREGDEWKSCNTHLWVGFDVDSQAQKIAEITALLRAEHGRTDKQAQRIKEQAQTIATNAAYAIELQGKIAEQAKEIEKLKRINANLAAGITKWANM